ncbi:Phytosulfokine [Hibiscus syriacus]|uniref:Phytosulfokine n=1 Tax=Hibiscus syriacus TaxID=106335 RepID=A0A6A3AYZ4_HIBSY|nr:phytosulfokines-like [Hibiscus syriacus]KAE8708275.1 Phytosulfokine [Hibiscus syriacus]
MNSKVSSFCLIVFLLLFFTLSPAAGVRPEPTAAQVQHPNAPIRTLNPDTETERVEADDICGGIKEEEEEECLMRRTLAAHVDYIYTQKTNP